MNGIGGTRVDFWKYTNMLRAFIGGVQTIAVAATNSHSQLWNPAGSGVILICSRASAICSAPSLIFLSYYATALTADSVHGNKWLSEPEGGGEVRTQTNAGNLGTIVARQNWQAVPQVLEFVKHDPIIIEPGLGLNLIVNTVNLTLDSYFEWIEA